MAMTIDTLTDHREQPLMDPRTRTQRWSCCRQAAPVPDPSDPSSGLFGRPGLWKPELDECGEAEYWIFDIPPAMHLLGESLVDRDREELRPLELYRGWADATASGEAPRGWQCPSGALIETWLPPSGRIVQQSTLARRVELLHQPDRLALRVVILSSISGELPEFRAHWLRQVLIDGHNRWRLVRIGVLSASPSNAIVAEVDLTGCPLEIIESVFRLGLSALRWAVQWLLESVVFLADSRCVSTALECV